MIAIEKFKTFCKTKTYESFQKSFAETFQLVVTQLTLLASEKKKHSLGKRTEEKGRKKLNE